MKKINFSEVNPLSYKKIISIKKKNISNNK